MFVDDNDERTGFSTKPVFNVMVQGPSARALQAYMVKLRAVQVRSMHAMLLQHLHRRQTLNVKYGASTSLWNRVYAWCLLDGPAPVCAAAR